MKKKVVSLLIAGLMVLEPCTMADAADLSDTEVIEQSVESAGDSVETEAMGETPEETGDIADPWYTGNFDITYRDVVRGCEGFLTYLEGKGQIIMN